MSGHEHIIYIKSAKTGGTSIIDALERSGRTIVYFRDIDNYRTGDVLCVQSDCVFRAMEYARDLWDKALKFAVVRNPYTKTASGYAYHPACRGHSLASLLELDPPAPSIYQIDWKKELPRRRWDEYSLYNHLLAPQTEFLYVDGRPLFDRLLRFESLDSDFQALCVELGYDTRLPFKNRTGNKHRLDTTEKLLIESRFDADFDAFGYHKDN